MAWIFRDLTDAVGEGSRGAGGRRRWRAIIEYADSNHGADMAALGTQATRLFQRVVGRIGRSTLGMEFDDIAAIGCGVTRRFDGEGRRICLTFDDSPNFHSTGRILARLATFGVRATFFCVGQNAAAQPSVIADIVSAGHEIGNHSMAHLDPFAISARRLRREIDDCQVLLRQVTGATPTSYRAPYGHFRRAGAGEARRVGVQQLALWDVGVPYDACDADVIGQYVIERAQGGSIIVLHDGLIGVADELSRRVGNAVVESISRFVPQLLSRGFEFATLAEMRGQSTRGPPSPGVARQVESVSASRAE